jgi:hypothetical protein
MCSTTSPTQFSGGPIKIVGTPPPGTPGAVQPDLPFAPTPYPMVATPDPAFETALNNALDAQEAAGRFGPSSRIAFSIIALASDDNHRYAGSRRVVAGNTVRIDDEMHFSASLVKVAAMYAAHELLAAARRLARKKGFPDAPAFRAALVSTFDPLIRTTAVPSIRNLVADPVLMGPAPKYDLIFDVTNTGVANEPTIEFTPRFQADLVSMISHGTNDGAARVIRKLSYAYINAALTAGGFFSATANHGIWLAGDYLGDKNKQKFNNASHIPYVRIPCTNDCEIVQGVANCGVAQISTTRLMSNMFALIELGRMPNADTKTVVSPEGRTVPDGNQKMRKLLSEPKPLIPGTKEADLPWVDQSRLHNVTARFTVTHDKIGVADLKRGPDVNSEGLIVNWAGDPTLLTRRHLTGKLAISWQNLVGPPPGHDFDGIARVINDAFAAYIATTP